ncbi:MAG: ferritin family protein [Thermodesulfobacteriota bacterium]|nr:ferritin family protein [Thermodesulfobacteriota bacterium]
MVFFSGAEIIEVAVQIERNGFSFYKTLADSLKDKDTQDLFNHLAGEEEKHIKSFQSLYESFKEYTPDVADKEEYYDYINMLASMNVFTKKEGIDEVVSRMKNKKDALDMAIRFEKDSVVFFTEIKGLVRESEKDSVENLICQEQSHLRRLLRLLKSEEQK